MTSIYSICKYLILAALLVINSSALAGGYIQLIPTFKATLDHTSNEIEVEVQLVNRGNEAAFNISIEILSTLESYKIKDRIDPQENAETKFKIKNYKPKLETATANSFRYGYIARIIYFDSAQQSFSAPQVFRVESSPSPSFFVSGNFDQSDKDNGMIAVSRKRKINFQLRNISSQTVRISNLQPLDSHEIRIQLPTNMKLPIELKPNELKEIPLQINSSTSFFDSKYLLGLLISVELNQIYSDEVFQFTAWIKEPSATNSNLMFFSVLVLISFFIIISWFYRKKFLKSRG